MEPPTVDPGAVVRMPPLPPAPSRRGMWIVLFAGAVILALSVGIVLGRASVEEPPLVTVEASDRGKLKVISTPKDSIVILDGRFVGVAPLENLDVEPGKHSIVVDVFGYEPYSGTVEVEPRSNAKLTVVLGPLGTAESTTGTVSGRGSLSRLPVPRSALQPTVTAPPVAAGSASTPPPRSPARVEPPSRPAILAPPPRPRRNCSAENSTCRDGCWRADSDCRFSCTTCTGCLSSMGQDECRRRCEICRGGCEQNKRFCESNCSSQQSSCEASNNY